MKTTMIAIALLLCTTANADLIKQINTVHDTETGLAWLDLIFTQSISVADAQRIPGFRHATLDEVNTLIYESAGIAPHDGRMTPPDPKLINLLNLIGTTGNGSAEDVAMQAYFDGGRVYAEWTDHPPAHSQLRLVETDGFSPICEFEPCPWIGHLLVAPIVRKPVSDSAKTAFGLPGHDVRIYAIPEPQTYVAGVLIALAFARKLLR